MGPLEVEGDDGPIVIGPPRERALLTMLALRAPKAATTTDLVDALWDDNPPRSALKAVQTYVVNLRHRLPPDLIATRPGGYLLDLPASDIDVHRFENLIERARSLAGLSKLGSAEALLTEALALWRGEPLADVDSTRGRAEATRIRELKLAAEEEAIDLGLALGRHSQLISRLEAAVAEAPLRERRWAQLMLALYRSDRQADALRSYRRLKDILGQELGIEPSLQLVALEEAILVQKPELAWSPREQLAEPASPRRGDLPPGVAALGDRPFVGRQRELEELVGRWNLAVAGQRQTVFVMGEPGIGKSTLVARLATHVADRGATVLYGHCDETVSAPYQPIAEALGGWLRTGGRDVLEQGPLSGELVRLLPELNKLRTDLPPPTSADPITEQYLLFSAVTDLVARLSAEAPVLLVLDDLHWADPSTLSMTRHLINAASELRLFVVATLRGAEPQASERALDSLSGLWRVAGTHQLPLVGLSPDDVAQLLHLSASEDAPSDTAVVGTELHRYTNGNPFFVLQLIDAVLKSAHEGAAEPRSISQRVAQQVPHAVQEAIRQRMSRLPDTVSSVLSVAAVVGPAVPLALLRRLPAAGPSTDIVLSGIDAAVANGLLVERSPGTFAFAHDLVRDYLYGAWGPSRRMDVHLSVAQTLEGFPPQGDVLDALAYHYAAAAPLGVGSKAAAYAVLASGQAMRQAALERARAQLEQAVEALETDPTVVPADRAHLMLALAGVCDASGDDEDNRKWCLEAATQARAAGSVDLLAAAAVQAAAPGFARLPDRRVLALCDEALDRADTLPPPLRAQLLASVAYYRSSAEGSDPQYDRMSAAAVETSRSAGDHPLHAFTLFMRYWTLVGTDWADERLAVAEELAQLAPSTGGTAAATPRASDYWQRPYALRCQAVSALEQGDRERFDLSVESLEALTPAGHSLLRNIAVLLRGTGMLLDGRLDEADGNLGAIAERATADSRLSASYYLQLCRLRLEQGRMDEVVPALVAATEMIDRDPLILTLLASAQAATGRRHEAAESMSAARGDGFHRYPRNIVWSLAVATAAETCVELGDQDWCGELYDLLAGRAGLVLVAAWGVACLGAADRYLGMLAHVRGDRSAAAAHLERASLIERRLGAPALVARTEYWQDEVRARGGRSRSRTTQNRLPTNVHG